MKLFFSALFFSLLFPRCDLFAVDHQPLSPAELKSVKRIAVQLVGIPVRDSKPVFDLLQPYVRSPEALKSLIVICSAMCDGIVHLRGGFALAWSHPNLPSDWVAPEGDWTLTKEGQPRITEVTILRWDKRRAIFSRRLVWSGDA